MADIVDELLELPANKLKAWSSGRKGRGTYQRRTRPKFTKEQLAEYLKENNFRRRDELTRGRKEGDPTHHDYRKEYGSWRNAIEEIFNVHIIADRIYVLKAIVEFNLWRVRDYKSIRKKRPDILPSYYSVTKEFGSWEIAKEMATMMSIRKTLQAYMELKNRLGRIPTLEECKMARILIDSAIEMYGSKKGLDDFVKSLESIR
jgi:hypothetical protein